MTIKKTNIQFNIYNKPEEVLVENNNNKDKELYTPDMKKHDVDNDCKEDQDIQQ